MARALKNPDFLKRNPLIMHVAHDLWLALEENRKVACVLPHGRGASRVLAHVAEQWEQSGGWVCPANASLAFDIPTFIRQLYRTEAFAGQYNKVAWPYSPVSEAGTYDSQGFYLALQRVQASNGGRRALVVCHNADVLLSWPGGEWFINHLCDQFPQVAVLLIWSRLPAEESATLLQKESKFKIVDSLALRVPFEESAAALAHQCQKAGFALSANQRVMLVAFADGQVTFLLEVLALLHRAGVKKLSIDALCEASSELLNLREPLYHQVLAGLTTIQVNYLVALCAGERQMSANETLEKYGIGTSANSVKIRRALLARNLIYIADEEIRMCDCLLRAYIRLHFLGISLRKQFKLYKPTTKKQK